MKLGTLVSALSAFPPDTHRHRPGPRNPAPAGSGRRHWWHVR
jgi:hypothetical protein